jgi:peptidyl-prolyl cis-trans isomerase SurA
MKALPTVRTIRRPDLLIACAFLLCATPLLALQANGQNAIPASSSMVIDRVIAVVNNHAILASDLQDEVQLSVLDSSRSQGDNASPQQVLEQLISQTLIEQQIRQEDTSAINPEQSEIDTRLKEIRNQLPACVQYNCSTDEGWKTFLDKRGLTPAQVDTYMRHRIQILRFIELRFRQGISISQKEVASYYNEKLLPQYSSGSSIPTLDQVAPRIQEILLQQQVNLLFDDWLQNMRKQGDVEILDPTLETSQRSQTDNGNKEEKK